MRHGRAVLADLTREAGETSLLVSYTPADRQGLTIASCECDKPLRYTVAVGSLTPLHAGSAGTAILSQVPLKFVDELERPRLTDATTVDLDDLHKAIARARKLGYATTVGQRIPEAAGASAPFFRNGAVAGAVNLTIPRDRLDGAGLKAHGARVRKAANRLTLALQADDEAVAVATPTDAETDAGNAGSGLYAQWNRRHRDIGERGEGRAVARVIGVLDILASCPIGGASAAQVAASVNTGEPTILSMLKELTRVRLARSMSEDRWEAGPRLLVLPSIPGRADLLLGLGNDVLDELVDVSGETACLVSYDPAAQPGSEMVFEIVCESNKPIRYAMRVGSRAPLHAGAAGKAVLAHLDRTSPPERLGRFTDRTIVDWTVLGKDLETTRRRGYTVSVGERIAEAAGIAAPFFRDGRVAGSLTLTIPRGRFSPGLSDTLGPVVAAAAGEITLMLSPTRLGRREGS